MGLVKQTFTQYNEDTEKKSASSSTKETSKYLSKYLTAFNKKPTNVDLNVLGDSNTAENQR
jgi:hypothetical protein